MTKRVKKRTRPSDSFEASLPMWLPRLIAALIELIKAGLNAWKRTCSQRKHTQSQQPRHKPPDKKNDR